MSPNTGWTYGASLEDDYADDWMDDFDGKIDSIEYATGSYDNVQMLVFVRPADYEYEARGDEPVAEGETEGLPRGYWGVGSDKRYTVSDDGMEVEGPLLSKRSTAAKCMAALVTAMGGARLSSSLAKLNEGTQPIIHWQRVKEKFKMQGEEREREYLAPSGPGVGKAVAKDAKKELGSSGTRTRRGAAAKVEETEQPAPETEAEAPAPTTKRRRRGAAAKPVEQVAPAKQAEVVQKEQEKSEQDGSQTP